MIKTVFEKAMGIGGTMPLLGVTYRRVSRGHPGPAPTATRSMLIGGDLRRSTRMMPDIRRLILLSILCVLASLAVTASASAGTLFTNSTSIKIPSSGSSGPATPYPSQITVSGMTGPITDVNVTLHRVGHTFTSDIAVLLVSPSGDTVKLMQTNCGGLEIEDFTWVFDQQAATPMPPPGSDGCAGFVYRPNPSSSTFTWPSPAPPGPHGVSLSDFNNEQANGTWSLYVADTQSDDTGDIEGGWSLSIETRPVDVAIPASGTSGPANPYPATLDVSGSGGITDLNVSIDGIWHEHPEDLDLLLVGPHGQKVILMSDACSPLGVSDYGWVWDDEAAAPMPQGNGTDVCGTRFHRPANYFGGDVWPAPAPAGPYSTSLSAFDFTNPNGEWKLFVQDDEDGGMGFFTNRFQLQITTDSTAPRVTSVLPANNATGVGLVANVRATFSEVMSDPSINSNTFKLFRVGTTTAVGASVTYDTPLQATLNPNNNLRPGTKYKAVVTGGARDLAGNQLDQQPGVSGNQPKVWFFTTRR